MFRNHSPGWFLPPLPIPSTQSPLDQSQNTLKSLDDRPNSFNERGQQQEDKMIHKGTRAAPNSQFHYSPHPGFLSQLRLPLNRELPNTHHNSDMRSQNSSTTSYSLSSSKPSLLSQSFRKPAGHGVSNTSPNLTNKHSQHYHPTPPPRSPSLQDESPDGEEYEHTPPHLTMTWRTVQSRTPPNRSRAPPRYSQGDEDDEIKRTGKLAHEDIIFNDMATAPSPVLSDPPLHEQELGSSSAQKLNKSRRPQERHSSSRPLRTGSKSSSSPTLREMLEADRQKTDAAKVAFPSSFLSAHLISLQNFFQPNLVHNSVFRKDTKHAVNLRSPPAPSHSSTERGNKKGIARSLSQVLGPKSLYDS